MDPPFADLMEPLSGADSTEKRLGAESERKNGTDAEASRETSSPTGQNLRATPDSWRAEDLTGAALLDAVSASPPPATESMADDFMSSPTNLVIHTHSPVPSGPLDSGRNETQERKRHLVEENGYDLPAEGQPSKRKKSDAGEEETRWWDVADLARRYEEVGSLGLSH